MINLATQTTILTGPEEKALGALRSAWDLEELRLLYKKAAAAGDQARAALIADRMAFIRGS